MFKKLFKKKKIIKKPNWFLCVLTFMVIFGIAAYIVYSFTSYDFVSNIVLVGDGQYISTYTSDISQFGYDGFTDEELEVIHNVMAVKQVMYNIPAIITMDNQELCNSSYAMSALVTDDNLPLTGVSRAFILHWDPETNPEAQKLLDYHYDIGLFHGHMFHVEDYYINFDTHTLYLGNVEVSRYTGMLIDTPFGISEKVVDVVDLTPDDRTLLEGFTHVDNNNYDDNYTLAVFNITGPAEGGVVDDTYEFIMGNSKHHLVTQYNESFIDKEHDLIYKTYACIVGFAALILSLIAGTIKYFMDRSTYSIFEYRRRTTNAMAHDLKTPLAIAALSVANLRENLGTDAARAEYHANEIDESISYMDQLICNILDFSNSETVSRALTRETVNVGAELEAHRQDIREVLVSRELTLDIVGSATRVTDRQIWNQALFNLIDNASRYATAGSAIVVNLGAGEITITNSVDKDIANAEKLKEPFVKGEDNRGENSGSGLGLAIADNNLSTLGYRLKLSCSDKKFTATIK